MKVSALTQKVFAVVLIALLAGCVRYIPSRQSLNRPYGFDPAQKYTGMEAFYRYEHEQRQRLDRLIADREVLLQKDSNPNYRVGIGDVVEILVKNFEEVTNEYRVDPLGNIRLPFVGKITVEGKTEDQLAKFIAQKVTDYVISPQVSVSVTEFNSKFIWVIGSRDIQNTQQSRGKGALSSVNRGNGRFPLIRRDTTLVDVLLQLGNSSIVQGGIIYLYPVDSRKQQVAPRLDAYDSRESQFQSSLQARYDRNRLRKWQQEAHSSEECLGDMFEAEGALRPWKACYPENLEVSEVDIRRKYDSRARIEIDLEDLFGGITERPLRIPLLPGDAIMIPGSPMVQVFGEVQRRGTFQFTGGGAEGRTGSDIKPFLLSAIIAAGGLTYSANVHEIEVFRELQYGNKAVLTVDLEEVVLRGAQDVRLRDGDIIRVPSQRDRFTGEHTIGWVNQLAGGRSNSEVLVE